MNKSKTNKNNFNVIVAGSRSFADKKLAEELILKTMKEWDKNEFTLICGMCRGADLVGYDIAKKYDMEILEYPAKWDFYGKSAGYRRNGDMARIAHACIVFWDGRSRGTEHMIELAKIHGLKLKVIRF